MNIKLKISGFLAWLFGWEKEESYTVDISPASKRQGEEMKKTGPSGSDIFNKSLEDLARASREQVGVETIDAVLRDKLARRKKENEIRNDTARSIRGIK